MNGFVLSGLAGLLIVSVGSSYADAMRISAINESATKANLIFSGPGGPKVVPLGSADATLFTANYNYPSPILFQTAHQITKPCHWSTPPVGRQVMGMRSVNVDISTDKTNNSQICLLDWH